MRAPGAEPGGLWNIRTSGRFGDGILVIISSKKVVQSGGGKETRRSWFEWQSAVGKRAAAPCPAPARRAREREFLGSKIRIGDPRVEFPDLGGPAAVERTDDDARGPGAVAPFYRQVFFGR